MSNLVLKMILGFTFVLSCDGSLILLCTLRKLMLHICDSVIYK